MATATPPSYSTTSNHIDAAVDIGHAVILLCRLHRGSHSASSPPLLNNVTALAAAALGPTSLTPSVQSHRRRPDNQQRSRHRRRRPLTDAAPTTNNAAAIVAAVLDPLSPTPPIKAIGLGKREASTQHLA
jgi:hypothetical protein